MLLKDTDFSRLSSLRSIGLSKLEFESPLITDEPKLPNYLCFPNDDFDSKKCHGQGFDTKDSKARIKSIAECLERICMFYPKSDSYVFSKFDTRKGHINPMDFIAYSSEQVDRELFKSKINESTFSWWPGINLLDQTKVQIPAQLIFLSNDFENEFSIRRERISTGCAFGKVGESRALSCGFFENIERDAIIGAYLNKKVLPRIKNMPHEIEELIDYYKRYNLETYVFDATSDLRIPVVMSLVLDRTGIGEAVNLGAKSGDCYLECIRGSLFEAIQPRRAARMTHILNPEILSFDSSKPINGMEERYAYWMPVERINDLDFWLNTPESVNYNKLPKKRVSLKDSLEIMRKVGFSVYLADMTLSPIREKGFESLKVLIPQLHPLYLAENAKALYSVHYGEIPDNPKLKPHPFT